MIVFDTVRRYLEAKGYDVNFVSNFTDVDDKIIKKANEEGVSCLLYTSRVRAAVARNTNSAAERNTLKSLDTIFLHVIIRAN